ncbi:DUF6308 family protein [Terrabacter sp. MAHUQ-38]|uniref:DUF6308 family protein n=1 Tax=unclassified Terrabacter TaxID=2630222 RepID=UPI00165E0C57|nr:DUF6308 family protein [Terrabacter sp. MAHUQ-38]MBC9820523.1 hypothetical protein [Terrabacter sp. MAHUQ-38]
MGDRASKFCARKRPDLFPVRDRVVCRLLGIERSGNARVDWMVFRHLISDPDVRQAIHAVVGELEREGDDRVELDTEPLRLLDAALWTKVSMA